MKNNNQDKFMGRYHDLAVTVIGALITGIIGTCIAVWLESKMHDSRVEIEAVRFEVESAQKVYHEISAMVDRRSYMGGRVFDAMKDHGDSEITSRLWREYMESVNLWNSNWNRVNSSIELYYGKEVHQWYADNINWRMVKIHEALVRLRKNPENVNDIKFVEYGFESLKTSIYGLNARMIQMIQRRRVGAYVNTDDKFTPFPIVPSLAVIREQADLDSARP